MMEVRDAAVGRGIESLRVSSRGRSVSINSGVGGAERGENRGWERF